MARAIQVRDLEKRYRLGLIGGRRLQDDFSRWWAKVRGRPDPLMTLGEERKRSNVKGQYVWALNGIDLDVEEGEVLGIIGRNGAGKSTLLKVLSRITAPTSGEIRLRGRVASLLEVGTGFHKELTGRENIYINGAILGMKREEIDERVDEIIDFSGVEDYIDTPVKRYSTGMRVRLGFSVAAHLDPEILLVDEVLAVGDAGFQKKCIGKMEDSVHEQGRTVLFVSHQMDMVRELCERCIMLDDGKIVAEGSANEVVDEYLERVTSDAGLRSEVQVDESPSANMYVTSARLLGPGGEVQARFDMFEPVTLEVDYVVEEEVVGAVVHLAIWKGGGQVLISFDADGEPSLLERRTPGRYRSVVRLPVPLLKPGRYQCRLHTGIPTDRGWWQDVRVPLVFDVELVSRPSAHASYAGKRGGVVATELDWDTVRLGSSF